MAEEMQMVVFKLKTGSLECEYVVPITQVQEIIPIVTPTKLPQAPHFVEGIINLRGKIIPIIDLKKIFNMDGSEISRESRSVVVEVEGQTVGIVVDEVSEVLRLPCTSIEPPPSIAGGVHSEFLTGVGKVGDRLLILLDMDKILNDREKSELLKVGSEAS